MTTASETSSLVHGQKLSCNIVKQYTDFNVQISALNKHRCLDKTISLILVYVFFIILKNNLWSFKLIKHMVDGASVNRNAWGGDPESLGQIDLPKTLETSHYLLNITIGYLRH